MLDRMGQNHSDHFQTPARPVIDLLNYIENRGDPSSLRGNIWEPAQGKGRIVQNLRNMNYKCYGSDIMQGYDFLTQEVINELYSCIITNPPFSLKNQFLKRCYDLQVPFALLLPVQAISGIKRSRLFKDHGLQVLVLPKRVDFEYEDGSYKGKPWFSCAWYTNGFKLPKDLDWL